MFLQQFFVKGLAHSSYLVAGAKTCAIVDPRRDVQLFLPGRGEGYGHEDHPYSGNTLACGLRLGSYGPGGTHGGGSLCGRAMGAMRTSTIGYERKYNAALRIKDRKTFVESLTTNMPGAPDHFSRCSAINGTGPMLVRKTPALAARLNVTQGAVSQP